MSNIINKHLKQTATYWGTPVEDGFGGATFKFPVNISVRWSDVKELFINVEGKEVQSSSRVYIAQDMDLGGYLYLGLSNEPNPKDQVGARKIKGFAKTPNLKATDYVRKVWL